MVMEKIMINTWKLRGYNNYVPLLEKSREINAQTKGVTFDMDVTTPHSIYDDLQKYGYIDDPYFELNSTKCEWVANRWWVYFSEVDVTEISQKMKLVCEGIDGKAHIYVNEQKIGMIENTFVAYSFDITNVVRSGKNQVKIIIEHAPDEYGQIGFSNDLSTQKPKFNYKWDFCTRLISLGINKPVYICAYEQAKIKDVYFTTENRTDGSANILVALEGELSECELKVEIGGKEYIQKAADENKISIFVDHVKLWNPNNVGSANLYDLSISLIYNEKKIDEKKQKVGFKKIEFLKNEGADQTALPYTYCVNGKKIYIKGVNITPLDQTCYTPDERYEMLIKLLKNANVNFIRVWGGGVIESDYFYELCDINGIMVMQEMTQSSTGIVNTTPKKKTYLKKLEETAVYSVKRLRNHVSLVSWSGGNEFMDKQGNPVTYDDKNIAMLKDIIERDAPYTLFYPSSASGKSENANIDVKGVNHDIHGPWKYYSNHYDFYNNIDSLWHGEFGVDGMMSYENLSKFLSPNNLQVSNATLNLVWRHHGEWWDTSERDEQIYGRKARTLEEMCDWSQTIQAEGLRYALEANRRRAFQNTGSVVWQANECYPNVFSTSLIDYYMTPKKAYYQLAKAYSPLNVNLQYDKLIWKVGEIFQADVFLTNDYVGEDTLVKIEVVQNDKLLLNREYRSAVSNGYSERLDSISLLIKEKGDITVKLWAQNGQEEYKNEICYFNSSGDEERG